MSLSLLALLDDSSFCAPLWLSMLTRTRLCRPRRSSRRPGYVDVVEVVDVAVADDAEMLTILGDRVFHRSFSFDLF